jgi:hypothetical protein
MFFHGLPTVRDFFMAVVDITHSVFSGVFFALGGRSGSGPNYSLSLLISTYLYPIREVNEPFLAFFSGAPRISPPRYT